MAITEYCLKGKFFVQSKAHHHIHHTGFAITYADNRSAFADCLNCLICCNFCTCGLNRKIKAPSAGQFFRFFYHITLFAVDDAVCAKLQSLLQTFFHNINYINFGYTTGFECHHGYQSDASCTEDNCSLSSACATLFCSMKAYRQRLNQSTFQCAYIVRKLKAQICLMSHILLEYTIYRRSCKEYNIRAQIVFAFTAEFTFSTGLSRLQSDSVSHFQMCNIFADFYNHTTWLMSENKRRFYHIVTDSSHLIVVHVASANTYILKFYQHFIICRYWNWSFCVTHFSNSIHNCYFHCSFHNCFLLILY